MKVAPERPHFFKPIVPGFKNGLKIPIGFFKYLKGHDLAEHAILRRGGKKWKVKVNGRRLEEGWEKFAEEHDLQLRDVLVFKYEGNLVFEVTIFDPNHCEREYERPQQRDDQREKVKEKTDSISRTSGKAFPNNVEASYKDMYNPHFTCTIRPYCLSRNFLSIPYQFARESRLKNRKCKLLVRDKRRSWTFNLYTCSSNTYFGSGWREFCTDNCLKEGDRLIFELVCNGETPTLRFYDLRGNPSIQPEVKKKNLDCNRIPDKEGLHFQEQKNHRTKTSDMTALKSQEPALTFAGNQSEFKEKPESNIKTSGKAFQKVEDAYKDMKYPHFIFTIRAYVLSRNFLSIPNQFVCKNRLNNRKCKVLVRDERRSWTFSLYSGSQSTYLGRGWREFCADNCLKEGDRLIFELVSNGETPTFEFYDFSGSQSIQPEMKKNNLDGKRISDKVMHFQGQTGLKIKTADMTPPKSQVADDANPHFISTIKPYTINKSVLYLPLDFVKSNGLMNRRCEMILIDEKRRSWSVQIGPVAPHFVIKSGLPEFIKANNVQVGDTYRFELINNGTTPIAYFHCKYSGKDAKNHISNSQDNEAVL